MADVIVASVKDLAAKIDAVMLLKDDAQRALESADKKVSSLFKQYFHGKNLDPKFYTTVEQLGNGNAAYVDYEKELRVLESGWFKFKGKEKAALRLLLSHRNEIDAVANARAKSKEIDTELTALFASRKGVAESYRAYLRRAWATDDKIQTKEDMPIRFVFQMERVLQDKLRAVAQQRLSRQEQDESKKPGYNNPLLFKRNERLADIWHNVMDRVGNSAMALASKVFSSCVSK
jgi:hypothetical protein